MINRLKLSLLRNISLYIWKCLGTELAILGGRGGGVRRPSPHSFMIPNIGPTMVNLTPDQIAQLHSLLVSLQTMLAFQASALVSQPSPQAIPVTFVLNPLQYIPSTFPSPSFPSNLLSKKEPLISKHLPCPRQK